MRIANFLAETTMETIFKHREWCVIPDKDNPNRFNLKETTTGKVLGAFILPENGDSGLLNLIGCAPELQDIAEMYQESMMGSRAEKSMIFSIVCEVLSRLQ